MDYGFTIAVDENETVEIQRKRKAPEPYPGYMMVGDGSETKKGGKSMDLLDICKELNTGEMNLMQFFRDEWKKKIQGKEKNTHVIVPTRSAEWTEYLQVALKKNYPHMQCLGIVQRVKRGAYMLNPNLFIPNANVEWYKAEWDKVTEECK